MGIFFYSKMEKHTIQTVRNVYVKWVLTPRNDVSSYCGWRISRREQPTRGSTPPFGGGWGRNKQSLTENIQLVTKC